MRIHTRPHRVTRRTACLLLGALLLAGCGSDGTRRVTLVEPSPLGVITLTLTPGSMTVAAGETGSAGVSVSRSGTFNGPVTLTASGQPGGVQVAFGSSPLASGAVSTSVTVTVPAGVIPGTYTVTVRGSGDGATTGETTLTLRTN